jgi:hypothetical protein
MKIELKRHGSYLKVDENGFVIPIVSKDLLQEKWKPLIKELIEYYKGHFKEELISVYIRGSVAKGEAVDFISDLDSFCVVKNKKYDLECDEFLDRMINSYPFCHHIELCNISKEDVDKNFPPRDRGVWAELIKTQSICVYGENLESEVEPFELKDMVGHSYYLKKDLEKLEVYLEEDKDCPEDLEDSCSWIAKRILRSGFDIVMEREELFTRDLYLCYESFSKYYPNKKSEMYKILDLAINPVSDSDEILKTMKSMGNWLIKEIGK